MSDAWSTTATVGERPKKKKPKKPPTVCGLRVTLRASNGYFLSGNNGDAPATVNGVRDNGESVRFLVENAGNGKVALKSCGKYLSVMEDGSAVTCDRPTRKRNVARSRFDWIKDRDTGQVSLRSANRKYVSGENGGALVTCNRDEAGPAGALHRRVYGPPAIDLLPSSHVSVIIPSYHDIVLSELLKLLSDLHGSSRAVPTGMPQA